MRRVRVHAGAAHGDLLRVTAVSSEQLAALVLPWTPAVWGSSALYRCG
jgi:hypothetical protein